MAVLQQIQPHARGPLFQLTKDVFVIGREGHCDLLITSPAVSRSHARIVLENSTYYLEDLQSRNGTLLNGRRISSREPLRNGDQIEFSTKTFVFYKELTLEEQTGSIGGGPAQIGTPEPAGDSDESIRREVIRPGDNISPETGEAGVLRESRVAARVPVVAAQLGALVAQDSTRKLLQALQLLQAVRSSSAGPPLLSAVLDSLFAAFAAADRIAIVRREGLYDGYQVLAARGRQSGDEVALCLPLIRECMHRRESLLYVDQWRQSLSTPPRLSDLSVRFVLCAPLLHADQTCFGAVQLDSGRTDRPPEAADLERLTVLASILAFVLERSDLRALEDTGRTLEGPTQTDRSVDVRGQVANRAVVPGYLLQEHLLPGSAGDLDRMEYIPLDDGRLAVLLLGVSGHGPEATSLATCLTHVVRDALAETGSAAQTLQRTAVSLLRRRPAVPQPISMAVVIVEPRTGAIVFSAAGHCPIWLVRPAGAAPADSGSSGTSLASVLELTDDDVLGPPLGVPRENSSEKTVQLRPGESLIIGSHGMTRVLAAAGGGADGQPLADLLLRSATEPGQLDLRLREWLQAAGAGAVPSDNLLLAVIQRHADDESRATTPQLTTE